MTLTMPSLANVCLVIYLAALAAGCQNTRTPSETPSKPFEPGDLLVYVATNGSDASGTGAPDRPWRTIQFAVDHVTPGSIIRIRPGIYHEQVVISGQEDSGVEGHVVVLKGEPGAIVDASGITPTDDRGILTIENADYILVEGLEFRNLKTPVAFSTPATPAGIIIRGSGSHIDILGNKIHGIEDNATCTQNDNNCDSAANGIGVYGTTPQGLQNITIKDNEVYDNILGASESLTINGNVSRFVVENNYVHDNNNIGIDVIGYETDICPSCTTARNRARNGIIRANRVENNSIAHFVPNPWYAGEDGNAAGIYVDGGHHILIERNFSSGNDLGIEIASEAPGGEASDVIVASNFFYNNFDIGIALGGYAANANAEGGGSIRRVKVINNSFYHNQGHSSEITMNYRIHDLRFVNNIIFGETAIGDTYEQAAANIQSSGLIFDNNLWWASQTIDTVPVADPHALVADPDFSDLAGASADINSGSVAIDSGRTETDITSWTDTFWAAQFTGATVPVHGSRDYDGNARKVGQVDIGATEQ